MTSHTPETDRKTGARSLQWQMLGGFGRVRRFAAGGGDDIGHGRRAARRHRGVLGVDRFLDMCRTSLNVTGDLVAATVIAAGEEDGRERAAA